MREDGVGDGLAREDLLAEAALDVVEDLRVRGVRVVQDVPQGEVRGPEAVGEVLREDPAAI